MKRKLNMISWIGLGICLLGIYLDRHHNATIGLMMIFMGAIITVVSTLINYIKKKRGGI